MTDYGDRALQKRIRIGFFDQYGSQEPLSSVAVRRDAVRDDDPRAAGGTRASRSAAPRLDALKLCCLKK
jgi:hypothetical protein